MSLGQWAREGGAFLTQFRYLHRDLPAEVEWHSPELVVLLHGLYASAGVLRPLRELLIREHDTSIFSFTYVPGPGIVELSGRLARFLAEEKRATRIHLVGHSLGGLVARHYATSPSADPRIVETVSIGSPFYGSALHYLVPGQAGVDLRAESPLLAELRAGAGGPPHLSLTAEDDKLILKGPALNFGEHVLLSGVGHNGLLFDRRVHALVSRRIATR